MSLCPFAIAAYGPPALAVLQGIPARAGQTVNEVVECLTGVASSDVVWEAQARLYQPAHIVCIDRANQRVVVALSGSQTLHDLLTDLHGTYAEVPSGGGGASEGVLPGGEGRNGGGGAVMLAHRGMLQGALALTGGGMADCVERVLAANEGFALRVVGHSLGGGVATLLAWLWRDRFPGVRAVAFAPPPTTCARLSRQIAQCGITVAFVLGDDIVARLSVGSVTDIARAAHALSAAPGAAARVIDHALGTPRLAEVMAAFAGAPAVTTLRGGVAIASASAGAGADAGSDAQRRTAARRRRGEDDEGVAVLPGGLENRWQGFWNSLEAVVARPAASAEEGEQWLAAVANTLRAIMQEDKLHVAGDVYWLPCTSKILYGSGNSGDGTETPGDGGSASTETALGLGGARRESSRGDTAAPLCEEVRLRRVEGWSDAFSEIVMSPRMVASHMIPAYARACEAIHVSAGDAL